MRYSRSRDHEHQRFSQKKGPILSGEEEAIRRSLHAKLGMHFFLCSSHMRMATADAHCLCRSSISINVECLRSDNASTWSLQKSKVAKTKKNVHNLERALQLACEYLEHKKTRSTYIYGLRYD